MQLILYISQQIFAKGDVQLMKQGRKISLFGFLLALSLVMLSGVTQATAVESIVAITAGPNNFAPIPPAINPTPQQILDFELAKNYYSVAYTSGVSFIQSVTFDLRADVGGFFDFDGDLGSLNSQTIPVLGTLTGLAPNDVSYVFSNFVGGNSLRPATLTFNFAPGSFGPGDSFSWGADTEFFVRDNPTPGGVFGEGGAIFSALLESGQSSSLPFSRINEFASVASISICPCPVPLPPALLLFGSGLLGVWGLKRRW
jgi:hypothetical protein